MTHITIEQSRLSLAGYTYTFYGFTRSGDIAVLSDGTNEIKSFLVSDFINEARFFKIEAARYIAERLNGKHHIIYTYGYKQGYMIVTGDFIITRSYYHDEYGSKIYFEYKDQVIGLTPNLNFYRESIEFEEMPCAGLCGAFMSGVLSAEFNLFLPTTEEKATLAKERKSTAYWGSGSKSESRYKFTPLRQTIVLLIAAMNNEL